jgi:hypothetical protein
VWNNYIQFNRDYSKRVFIDVWVKSLAIDFPTAEIRAFRHCEKYNNLDCYWSSESSDDCDMIILDADEESAEILLL